MDQVLVIPPNLALSTLRPDILLFSKARKRVILTELTSPCEENMEARHQVKLEKYALLCTEISHQGWLVNCFAVEVGARGFCAILPSIALF